MKASAEVLKHQTAAAEVLSIENCFYRLYINESTGLPFEIADKKSNTTTRLLIDFIGYLSVYGKSGPYLMRFHNQGDPEHLLNNLEKKLSTSDNDVFSSVDVEFGGLLAAKFQLFKAPDLAPAVHFEV